MADHSRRLVVKSRREFAFASTSRSALLGQQNGADVVPAHSARAHVRSSVGGESHWPTCQTSTIAERLNMTNVAAPMPQTITATRVNLTLHGYRCGESSTHVRRGEA